MSRLDLNAMAAEVVLLVKSALAPVSAAQLVLKEQIDALALRVQDDSLAKELGTLRERVAIMEARPVAVPDPAVGDLRDRLGSVEHRLQDDALAKELGTLRERVAVVEVKAMQPGPQGEPGTNGQDGKDGADGKAGLTYQGVWQDGKQYEFGDLSTWAGATWHCNEPTTSKPGDGSKAWTLIVKRGRDGRDGRDAVTVPVVSVGAR